MNHLSGDGIRRLESWAQVAIVTLAILTHMLATEHRLSNLEQKLEDYIELTQMRQGHRK